MTKFVHTLEGLKESSGFISHHLRLVGGPSGYECRVELDGNEIRCSRLEIAVNAHSHCEVTLTIPAAVLDVDTRTLVQIIQPVVISKDAEE